MNVHSRIDTVYVTQRVQHVQERCHIPGSTRPDVLRGVVVGAFEMIVGQKTRRRRHLNISNIEESVSIDPTRPCIYTSNKQNTKIHVRIHATFTVIRT